MKKEIDFYGVEMTKNDKEAIRSWLQHPEGKIYRKILEGMIRVSELNSMADPQKGADAELFRMQREQYLGERKGLRKIANICNALSEI